MREIGTLAVNIPTKRFAPPPRLQVIKTGAWTVYFSELGERAELERELAFLIERGLAPEDTKIVPSGGTRLVNGEPEDPALAVWTFKVLTVRVEG